MASIISSRSAPLADAIASNWPLPTSNHLRRVDWIAKCPSRLSPAIEESLIGLHRSYVKGPTTGSALMSQQRDHRPFCSLPIGRGQSFAPETSPLGQTPRAPQRTSRVQGDILIFWTRSILAFWITHLMTATQSEAPPRRRGDGEPVGLGDDAARRRGAGRAGHPARGRRSSRPTGRPSGSSATAARPRGGAWNPDRRGRGRGAPAGDARGGHDPARARRPGREQGPPRGRLAPVDRPDAAGHPGRDAGHRRLGRGQRGAAGRGDPGAEVSRRSARRWPRSARRRPTRSGESPL